MAAIAIAMLVGSAAGANSAGMAAGARSPLLPLSERDMASTRETGCQLSFGRGRDTLLFLIGHDLLIRTARGRERCRVSEAQFQGFGVDGGVAINCGGRRLSMRRVGAVTSNSDTDSAGGAAVLTIGTGPQRRLIRGEWGTAC